MRNKKIIVIMLLLLILLSNVCLATDVNTITTNEITIEDINNNIHTTNFILVIIFVFIFISYILRLKK